MKVKVGGVPFDDMTENEVVEEVSSQLSEQRGGQILTPNVDVLRQMRRHHDDDVMTESTLVVPDGMPIVWASRIMKTPLRERVTGASLVWSLSASAARRGDSIFLLGGAPGVAQQAAEEMTKKHPGLKVAGVHCPPMGFEHDAKAVEEVHDAIGAAEPDLVFVALGHPKQDTLAASLRTAFPHTWFLGCGGALTMAAAVVPRAPEWMGRCGMEWLHRFSQEPRRLFKRYFVHDLPFALTLLAQAVAHRLSPAVRTQGSTAIQGASPRGR